MKKLTLSKEELYAIKKVCKGLRPSKQELTGDPALAQFALVKYIGNTEKACGAIAKYLICLHGENYRQTIIDQISEIADKTANKLIDKFEVAEKYSTD